MGNLHIVTGYKGENHVTAADIASFQASIFGTGEYVLNRGNKFSTTVVSNNQIRVADGDILMQGRHIRMNEGTYVDLTIENGSQGYFRNDLIVARYTKDSTTGVEDCNLVVIKGTAVSADPVDPEYTTGDIIEEHVLLNDMPLYRVPLDGLNVGTLVPLWAEASISVSPADIGAASVDHTHTPASIGAEKQRLQFTNKTVAASAFVANSTYEDFGYRAAVALSGVTANMTPEVVFNVADAISGIFAPVAACYAGGIYLYAAEVPEATITIPTIICWKAVG